jgi:hypothetical protein
MARTTECRPARRPARTAALLLGAATASLAALGVTGCSSSGSNATDAASSPNATNTSVSGTSTTGSASGTSSTGSKPNKAGTHSCAPTTANHVEVLLDAVRTAGPTTELTVTAGRNVCDSGSDDGTAFVPSGIKHTVRLASDARITLITQSPQGDVGQGSATVADLARQVGGGHNDSMSHFLYCGGYFDLTAGPGGQITAVKEIYHP